MYRKIFISAALAFLLLTVFTGKASAQGSNTGPGNPTLLQAIKNLQNSVNALQSTINSVETTVGALSTLQSTVNNIQTAIDALSAPDQSNVRFTPPLFLDDNQGLLIGVTNVGDVPHMIKVELVDGSGHTEVFFSGAIPLGPGKSTGGSKFFQARDFHYFKFTVLDGSRTDIRGTAQHLLGGGAIGATVAAE